MRIPSWAVAAALGTVTAVSLALSGATPALATAIPEQPARLSQAAGPSSFTFGPSSFTFGPSSFTFGPDSTATPASPARASAALAKPGDTWTGTRLTPSSISGDGAR
jgi:hypothetical protein